MGNQRISDLSPLASGSLDKNLNVIPVVSGNETYKTTLTDLQSDLDSKSLKVSGSVDFSYPITLAGTWSTGGALSTPRYRTPGGAGDKNAALAFGGYTYSTYVITGVTEAYDGSSWSAVNPMINPRNNLAGFGSQNSAVAVGGNDCRQPWRYIDGNLMSCTEEYNGATWTVGGALSSTPYGRNGLSAVGTQNAGLAFGGYPEYVTPQTEKYDGSAWSAAAALNNTRYNSAGTGTQNAALMFGGATANDPTLYYIGCTEAYDGTTWSAQAGLSVPRYYLGGSGTQNATLAFGGYSNYCSYESCTEKWDGTAWSADTPLSNGRYSLGSTGNSTGNSLAFGGVNWDGSGTYCMNCTEEYTDGPLTHFTRLTFDDDGKTALTGSFQGSIDASSINLSSGSLNVPEDIISRGATIEGTMNIYNSSSLYCNLDIKGYEFNNISIGGTQITNFRQRQAGTGTLNAALSINGQTSNSNSTVCTCTEEYDGTSWAVGGATIHSAATLAAAGYQNSAIKFGGSNPASFFLALTEEYDGTTWTSGGNLNRAASQIGGSGTQDAALAMGGRVSFNSVTPNTEEYNGTTWSIASDMNIGRQGASSCLASAGTQNATIVPGAYIVPGTTSTTEEYNGTSWSTLPSISDQTSFDNSAGGSVNDAILMGCNVGVPSTINKISKFNGVSWTIGPNLLFGVARAGSTTSPGTGTTGAVFGGCVNFTTQEYTNFGIIVPKFGVDTDGSITSPSGSISIGGSINVGDNIISEDTACLNSQNAQLGNSLSSAWSAGGALPRNTGANAGAGTQNAALSFGGFSPSQRCTDEYDGTSWSAGGALINNATLNAGIGTQNAALSIGGTFPITSLTEEYDGSTWSAGGALITGRCNLAGAGTQNAGLVFGGQNPAMLSCTEEYNGLAWSVGGSLINLRRSLSGVGYINAALAMSGIGCNAGLCTEEYDGSTWSNGGTAIIEQTNAGHGGVQNDAFIAGGASRAQTYHYNGLSYARGNDIITQRACMGSGGDTGAGIIFAGVPPFSGPVSCTEEGNNIYVISPRISSTTREGNNLTGVSKLTTLTPSQRSWSAGGNMIQGTRFMAGTGIQNAALATGRFCATEEYNGSTWSAGGNLINARCSSAAAGIQNAALLFGGLPTSFTSCTEEYNGSSWSAGGALITGRSGLGGAGTQNAGLAFGGVNPAILSCTEAYDGSTWSAGGALITGRSILAGLGTQNSALAIGGFASPTTLAVSEEYNGSTWSAGGNLINARHSLAGAGYQDTAVVFGGTSPITSRTEEYDGSTWSSANNMINTKCSHAGAGFQSSALAFGGQNPSVCASLTEEYSYATSTETTFEHTDTGRLVFAQVSSSLDFVDDTAAAAGGVPLGGIYRSGSLVRIRLS